MSAPTPSSSRSGPPRPVRLAAPGPGDGDAASRALATLAADVHGLAGGGIPPALAWAVTTGPDLPLPGGGGTLHLWEALATAGAHDLTVARVLEPHLDALAILDQAGSTGRTDQPAPAAASWGVWAAESPDARLEAHQGDDGAWLLTGRKPWCSLAGEVSHALVTAWREDGSRGLYAVALDSAGVRVEGGSWSAFALADVVTSTVALDGVAAQAVGEPGWYIRRSGFAWGGLGVAAVWYGGAVGLARRLREQCGRREPDQVGWAHLGAVDAALHAARATLAEAAGTIDNGAAGGAAGALLAARGRQVVADAVDTVTAHVARALGPGPLAHEPEHARRVADLALYVRQHHGERDQAALGRALLADPDGSHASHGSDATSAASW